MSEQSLSKLPSSAQPESTRKTLAFSEAVLLSRESLFNLKVASNADMKKYRKTDEAIMCGLLPKSPTATLSRIKDLFLL
ncbi:hypothetical protein Tco_0684378 [Tanacetum coccineum]